MSNTTIERNAVVPLGDDLQQFQRDVSRVVADLVITNCDGEKLCTLTAKTEMHDDPLQAVKGVIISFVDQWAKMYNNVVRKCRTSQFGHLEDAAIQTMDVVQQTGIALFCALKQLHEVFEKDNTITDKRLDMATAMKSLKFLRHSYDCNLSNEVLGRLAA